MKKTAPQDQGAARVSLKGLRDRCGIPIGVIAKWMNIEEATVAAWESGEKIPNACQCMWLSVILNCPLKEIYMALLNS